MTRLQFVQAVCFVGMAILAFVLTLAIVGCATSPERFLTQEQDEQMRETCKDGCVTMPRSVFQQIQQMMRNLYGS